MENSVKVTELGEIDLPLSHLQTLDDILGHLKKYSESPLQVAVERVGEGIFISESHHEALNNILKFYSDPSYAAKVRKEAEEPEVQKRDKQDFPYWNVDNLHDVIVAASRGSRTFYRIKSSGSLTGVATSFGAYQSLLEQINIYQDPKRVLRLVKGIKDAPDF